MLDHVAILLAEDDRNDVFLMGRAFDRAGIPNPLCVVHDGREAVEYLSGDGEYADREQYPMPGLMLLDLKLPRMDGFDVLAWLRSQRQFDTLPVVVLSSSKVQADIDRSRELGVYDYRVKPHDFEDLVRMIDDIRKCWLDERFNRYWVLTGATVREDPATSQKPAERIRTRPAFPPSSPGSKV